MGTKIPMLRNRMVCFASNLYMGVSENEGYLILGVLIIRILLFRVL